MALMVVEVCTARLIAPSRFSPGRATIAQSIALQVGGFLTYDPNAKRWQRRSSEQPTSQTPPGWSRA